MTIATPYTNEHKYDIQDMITLYGSDNLVVDDTLGILVMLQALSIYYQEIGETSTASNFDYLLIQHINMYNKNKQTIGADVATVTGGGNGN